MANRTIYTNEAALNGVEAIALTLADSGAVPPEVGKLRLFDETLVPTTETTKAQLVAAETTLTGYPVGGYPVDDMEAALFAPAGGAIVTTPLVTVVYASGPAVQIGGYWYEDHAGKVRQVFVFDPVESLAAVGDGFPIVAQFGYGNNGVEV